MDNKTTVTTKHYFKILNILFYALVSGQILFTAAAVLIRYFNDQSIVSALPLAPELIMLALSLFTVMTIAASWLLFTIRLKSIKNQPTLAAQLKSYRSAQITRYAIMETPSLMAIVAFILSGNYLFLACVAVIILSFLLIRPTSDTLIAHLQLAYEDQLLIRDPEAVLYEEEWHIQ